MNGEEINLNSVEVIGKILLFTPIIAALPSLLYAIIRGNIVSIGDSGAGLMMSAGLITLFYASIKGFKISYANSAKK